MSARKPIAQHKPIPERTGTFILIRFAKCEWVMKPYTDWFREDGKKWWNRGGGYQPATKDPAVTILRRVENATWKTLDRAPIVTPDDPLPELTPKTRAGWLAPDGTWYGCAQSMHETVAERILGRSGLILEQTFCHVHAASDEGHEHWQVPTGRRGITRAQLEWLDEHGYRVLRDDWEMLDAGGAA